MGRRDRYRQVNPFTTYIITLTILALLAILKIMGYINFLPF